MISVKELNNGLEKTSIEEQNFMRFPETKKDKFWKKNLIKQKERSNPLLDQLKDLQMIKEIFSEKKQELPISTKPPKRNAKEHNPKGGKKKIKRN